MNLTTLDPLLHALAAARQAEDLPAMLKAADSLTVRLVGLANERSALFDFAANLVRQHAVELGMMRVCMCCGRSFKPTLTEHVCSTCAEMGERVEA